MAAPLYYWFISGFLKNAFDRLFAIAECDPNYRNPKYVTQPGDTEGKKELNEAYVLGKSIQ